MTDRARQSVPAILPCLAVAISLQGGTAAQQDQSPAFRSRTDLVQVTVLVRDARGHDVTDLPADAFEISDEKQRVPIAVFARVGDGAGAVAQGSDVATSASDGPRDPHAPGRVFVILFDDLHTAPQHAVAAQSIATRLLEHWTAPGDLLAVRQVSDPRPSFTLTPDRVQAAAAVATFAGHQIVRPQPEEAVLRVRQVMDTLAAVARVSDVARNRRVAVVWLSGGFDYDIFNTRDPGSTDVVQSMAAATAALRRSNVVLYALDPRGLVSTEGDVVERGGGSSANGGVADALSVATQRLSLSRLSLRHLAEETGGFASINSNDFTDALARIGHETSHYYLLGFYPADASCQYGTRKLRVKVHRPNLRVVARVVYACSDAKGGLSKARPSRLVGGSRPMLVR